MQGQEIYNLEVLRCWHTVPSTDRQKVKSEFVKLDAKITELKKRLQETTTHAFILKCVHDYIEQAEDDRTQLNYYISDI